MSIFPTKILLATDGSEDAKLAARTAADLAQKTASELHVIYVGGEGFYETPPSISPRWNRLGSRGSTHTSCRISSGQSESCSTMKSSR
jgi:nucleotide-binding universal stress UspA family protein